MDPIGSLDDLIQEPKPKPHRLRLLLLQCAIILAFVALSIQLYRLQIVQGDQFRDRADNNRFRNAVVDAPRGIIYDRNGFTLVRNEPAYIVAIVPADLPKDPDPMYKRLARLLEMDPLSIKRQVDLKPQGERVTDAFTPVPIKTVDPKVAYTVDERHLDLPGVHVRVEPARQYLDGRLTSQILGYVGRITEDQYNARKANDDTRYKMSDRVGQAGLEEVYETLLRGRPGNRTMEVDVSGREVRALSEEPPLPGKSLRLSIDLPLQREMTRILSQELPARKSMVGIAMDPRNGQVLAMVALPSYDNNLFVRGISDEEFAKLANDPGRPLVNHAIADVYPPGSTFKMFTAAGALQEGVVRESNQVYDPGYLEVSGNRFVCWATHGYQDIISALADSCDTYFYTIGGGNQRDVAGLGVARIKKWAMLFGLGAPTGIDLPNEEVGNVPDEEWKLKTYNEKWYLGDTYNYSIGQGFVTATPIQILAGTVAVANGGTLFRPQLVKEVVDDNGNIVQPFTPQVIRQIEVAPQHFDTIREGLRDNMLVQGTTRYGTNFVGTSWDSEVPDIKMAGKTGTAEYGYPDKDGKLASHGWFAAFAPYDNPEITILVFEEEGGGRYAANVVAKIMRWYFRVPPEKRGPGGY